MIDYFILTIKVVFSLVFVLCLIYLSFKYGGGKLQSLQNARYLQVLERVPLSKENNILVVKMGSQGYVLSSSQSKIEIIKEITEEDLLGIENSKMFTQNRTVSDILKNWRKKGRLK